ncbi:scavenger receptor cysteine-rich domain-containing protein DMBT1-like [Scyliorhinus torazame]|uniref:scavenger receptor cysteine-rich domain-containing protein DMBT1-like n=1 Tax=Scyliorhinus torazame TaxID=75743 RepID=UPI003B5AD87B
MNVKFVKSTSDNFIYCRLNTGKHTFQSQMFFSTSVVQPPGRPGDNRTIPAELQTLRLVDGGSPCSGRVEIHYRGQWGTVLDSNWDMRDAAIVCRELDCGTALSALGKAHFGKGNGTHVTGNVECTGTETALSQCASDRWDHEAENSHSDDAGVICSGSDKLRLVNGSSPCAGRLEIYSSGSWSTVWGDEFSWSSLDADVVCKELDCGSGVAAPLNSHFGQGPGPVIGPPGCGHQQDVGVICSDANWSLRLTDGGSRCDGRVEIYYDRAWGRIQDKLWDLNDAHVVCRQLGCGDGIAAYNSSKDGASARSVWLIDIQCNGNEAHLQNCSSSLFNYSLNDSTGIGVLCSGKKIVNFCRVNKGGISEY